jgi:hypothetical protein
MANSNEHTIKINELLAALSNYHQKVISTINGSDGKVTTFKKDEVSNLRDYVPTGSAASYVDGQGLYVFLDGDVSEDDGVTNYQVSDRTGSWRLVAPHWDYIYEMVVTELPERFTTEATPVVTPRFINRNSSYRFDFEIDGIDSGDMVSVTPPVDLGGMMVTPVIYEANKIVVVVLNTNIFSSYDASELSNPWKFNIIKGA